MSPNPLKLLVCLIGFWCVGSSAVGKTGEQAWSELVGNPHRQRPAFAYVDNDPQLPNVLIYGDSISIAYTPPVRQKLAGRANVYRLYRNGVDSGQFVPLMQRMHKAMQDTAVDDGWAFDWDVIHFNVGLHDLKYLRDGQLDKHNGKQVGTPEQYAKNLDQILAYLKRIAPRAKLIFATTTPVPENAAGRFAGDAARYNQAAREVLRRHPEVVINDLYALTQPRQQDWWVKPGNVHFNRKGVRAQGDAVAEAIRSALPKQPVN